MASPQDLSISLRYILVAVSQMKANEANHFLVLSRQRSFPQIRYRHDSLLCLLPLAPRQYSVNGPRIVRPPKCQPWEQQSEPSEDVRVHIEQWFQPQVAVRSRTPRLIATGRRR